ncbi:MAG: hypothetical protein A2X32_08195 [Elusimicrobia bacterium GWC2_64_44]|nr:MAG: hypothetical protein A2X32_08195 [Elusimicrobia bacterium GWC2_64_44]
MPRQARIDAAGQVYHVMSRGIERRKIFLDDEDCADFCERMSVWLKKTGGRCLAWCLMPNHFHFLLLRGERPISELMHRVMTGYAVHFNLRHCRAGHLFQNRYKAIVCDLEGYLVEAAAYIHLNPLRAKLVGSLAELEDFEWCGHNCAVTGDTDELLDREALLSHFGGEEGVAMANYMDKLIEKSAAPWPCDLSGGGLLRSYGGGNEVLRALRAGEKVFSDQRILGGSDFVESILRAQEAQMALPKKTCAEVMESVVLTSGISRADIVRRTRERVPARARAVYCHLAREEAGCSVSALSRELGITESAVSKLALRGRLLVKTGKQAAVQTAAE